jgi:hypothetical protein
MQTVASGRSYKFDFTFAAMHDLSEKYSPTIILLDGSEKNKCIKRKICLLVSISVYKSFIFL